jgi:hypothetical protein
VPIGIVLSTLVNRSILEWGAWSFWGKCSVSCGGGSRFKTRECIGGNPDDEGCTGPFFEKESCMPQNCPAGWRQWSPWSPCSNSCGHGQQTRVRDCKEKLDISF